jgi:hypothetical protein
MKLFSPDCKNQFVFAVLPKAAKEGTAPAFRTIDAYDFDEASRKLDKFQLRNAYPYPMGRYDEFGRYMTYKPPIDGVTPGRFALHPHAEEERRREEAFA